jgi:hypothetical protein
VGKKYWALENAKPDGSEVTLANLTPIYLPRSRSCPAGGVYTPGRIGETPSCSINSPWHQRHFHLNYCNPDFVIGERVRVEGYAQNTTSGPALTLRTNILPIRGGKPWPAIYRGSKVTVFGRLVRTNGFCVDISEYQLGWYEDSSPQRCLVTLKQIDGAKAVWALDHHVTNDVPVRMSDLVRDELLFQYPSCYSGGIYISGRLNEHTVCSQHGDLQKRDLGMRADVR